MQVSYDVRRVGDDEWHPHTDAKDAFSDFEARLDHLTGPYSQRAPGTPPDFGPWFGLDETMKRVREKFAKGDPGTKVIVRSSDPEHEDKFAIRKSIVSEGPSVLRVAYAQLGDDYNWASDGPDRFDCSGFTAFDYEHGASAYLPHSAHDQYWVSSRRLTLGEADKLKPGDLLFYNVPNGRPAPNHVGIYAGVHEGKRKVLDASSSADAIVYRDWDLNPLYAFGYLLEVTGKH
jgi:hypothetical protein